MKLIPESEADKTKDVFVGLWRPPLAYVMNHVSIRPELTNHDSELFGRLDENGEPTGVFKSEQRVKERWMVGDFDSCLYQRLVPDVKITEWRTDRNFQSPAWFWSEEKGLSYSLNTQPSSWSHWTPFISGTPSPTLPAASKKVL